MPFYLQMSKNITQQRDIYHSKFTLDIHIVTNRFTLFFPSDL